MLEGLRAIVAHLKAVARGTLSPPLAPAPRAGSGGWFPIVREPFTGAWQRNLEWQSADVLSYSAVYACVTLIARDIGKLRIKLVAQDEEGIWEETENPAFSPVLKKPNRYQTRIKFLEQWQTSRLTNGNTYVLKARDARGVVNQLYVLDPARVRPLIADDGGVYYELKTEYLAGLSTSGAVVVPASEIIHDVMVPLYHPLVGVTPLTACGLAALQGMNIQEQSTLFFSNGSNPSGVITTPQRVTDASAKQMKADWQANFTGTENIGQVAILGDGMKYTALTMTALDAQLIDQLKWTAENVCTAFHESLEVLLDEGLELPKPYGTELDLDDLLRMDTPTRVTTAKDALNAGMSPNEVRKRYHYLGSATGGDSPMVQQQYYSLEALAQRDAAKPFAKPAPATPPAAAEPAAPPEAEKGLLLVKVLERLHRAA
jgi:HK97 family phage portal protein